jgi:hypothetical protein
MYIKIYLFLFNPLTGFCTEIFDKCNVHGERRKVANEEIDGWSREKERNISTESNN